MENINQKEKPQKDSRPKDPTIPFPKLFTYATNTDKLFLTLGAICAIVQGACMPVTALLMGGVADDFSPGNSGDQIVSAAGQIAWKFAVVGVVAMFCAYVAYASWMIIGEKQTVEIRRHYFRSLLKQEIAFYDSINPNELSTRISEECFNIQQAITEKIPTFASSMSTLLTGFIIGYVKGWQLALVMSVFLPVMSITGGIFVMSMQKLTKMNNEAYGQAGAISEEVLNAIRTVVSLGGQAKEIKRYQKVLEENKKPIIRFSVSSGITLGVLFFGMIGIYALGFFVGSIFVEDQVINPVTDKAYSAGDILTIFFSIIMGSFSPAKSAPCLKAFAIAKASGAKAFAIIDRKSKISIEDPKGLKPTNVEGNIIFRNVTFAYPLKAERIILDGINFEIKKNQKTALVGESGCGKTTCMQLIERFYDIEEGNGSITLDGNELKNLNLKWMRENIGYVGQEPVLFATSIKENLLMVKIDATEDEIWDALRKANAYDFVQSLPDKLNTFVGANGTQLSGGQKQRLAIARAILKNPRILLLDEATSALDRKNEMEIQKTLDEISEGRTTIVIAHRLSTIRNADHIIMFEKGKVAEEGTHEELVALKGKYYTLQKIQLQTEEQDKKAEEENNNKRPEQKKNAEQVQPVKQNSNKNLSKVHHEQNYLEVEVDNGKYKDTPKKESLLSDVQIYKRLFSYNKGDIHLIGFAIIGALVRGTIIPLVSIILSNMLEVLALPNAPDYRERANILSLYFLICAIVDFFAMAITFSCCNVVAERLSRRVRAEVFNKYLKMPIGWFDDPENSPGALGSRLSTDAALINTLTSSAFTSYFEAASSFATGMIISFTASWQLTLVGLALSPLQISTGAIRSKFSQTFRAGSDKAYQSSVAFASEAINNMRTVASFGKEEELLKSYSNKLEEPLRQSRKNGHFSGLAVGGGDLVSNGINAIMFYLGAVFIRDIDLSFKNMFQSIMGIIFAAAAIGSALSAAPDIGAGKNAALNIFRILDTKPAIDMDDPRQTVRKPITGDIEFRNVWFKYPSREKQIFKGLNLKIHPSNKVALVGPSGCGKSTILALLQRFYDVDQGEILIDGVNIKEYDLRHLRSYFGVVSQEPVLFNGTIEYNIKYSKEDATEEEMRQAATKASAIGFIESNQFDVIGDENEAAKYGTGFKRKVGPKGGQLSGGQKQRIAIARAIMKDPSVLILDEATSALDAQNEKIVQASLDNIMQGKTSVIVAHRISTIKDANEIIVFYDGEIRERGTYQELTEKQGIFYKLERGLNL